MYRGFICCGFVQFFNCSRLYYNYSASNSCAKARKFRWNVGEKREREKEIAWKKDHAAYTCQRQQRFFEFSTRNTDRISRNTVGSSGKTSLSVVPSLHVLPPPPGRMNTFATFRRPLERRRLAAAQRGNNKDA